MWYSFCQVWVQVFFILFFQVRVLGRHNIPSGAVILAANHQSYLDPPLVGLGLHRQIHPMARKSLFHHTFIFTWLIRSLNAFPVERDRGDIAAVREMMRRLDNGAMVVAFPEATRTYTGEIGPFKPGVFMIANRAGIPVVPTLVHGAFESWPRASLFPRPSPVTVAYGAPLYASQFNGDPSAMSEACRNALLALQRRLCDLDGRSA